MRVRFPKKNMTPAPTTSQPTEGTPRSKAISKRPPKTIKEKKFVKAYIETGNATEAAMQVYDCKDRDVAASIGGENLVKLEISSIMDNHGLTNDKLVEVLKNGLEANRVISAISTDKEAPGATTDFIDVPDHATRHKYLETAFKLKGELGQKQEKPSGVINNFGNLILQSRQERGLE